MLKLPLLLHTTLSAGLLSAVVSMITDAACCVAPVDLTAACSQQGQAKRGAQPPS